MRLLIIGLGNPGARYLPTRHNLGFRVLDRLAEKTGAAGFREKENALVCRAGLPGIELLLAKPTTYVNNSGAAVLALLVREGLDPGRLLVVCDDLSIPFGEFRLRGQGSSGGHNGLQSIIDRIGPDFARLRIGIGPAPEGVDWADFVLSPFSPEEESGLPDIIEEAMARITSFVNQKKEEKDV